MIDTHCHLNHEVYKGIAHNIIEEAKASGVDKIVVPGYSLESAKKAVDLAESFEEVYAAVGIQPTEDLKRVDDTSLTKLALLIESSPKVRAIGEIGLDYYRGFESYALQKKLFINQLQLAARYNLSVVVHNRHASKDLISYLSDFLAKNSLENIVFHCCEPDIELLEFAVNNGIFIGVDGDVTYDSVKIDFVKKIPIDLLVLETDSPYLVPEPLKSQKVFPNKPTNLKIILEHVANLRSVSSEKLDSLTSTNAQRLFRLGK